MRVLVAGTGIDDHVGQETRDAAIALGRALAQARHRLVTCGWPGVDRIVAEAFIAELGREGVASRAYFQQVVDVGRAPPIIADGDCEVLRVDGDDEAWGSSIDRAEVVVLLAGEGGTYETFARARSRCPVLPLPRTGGDAARVFAEITGQPLPADLYGGLTEAQIRGLDVAPGEAVGVVVRWIEEIAASRRHAAVPPVVSDLGAENERAFTALCADLRNPGLMGFVGAGLSAGAGYPLWGALLDMLEKELPPGKADDYAGAGANMLVRAARLREDLGEARFGDVIRRTFAGTVGEPTRLHLDLLSLPLTHVLTTNYDDLLERAHARIFGEDTMAREWTEAASIRAFLAAARRRHQPRHYVHLHGVWTAPEQIVLSLDDYERRYYESPTAEAVLSVVLSAYQILFVGFSFTDLDVMGVFQRSLARLRIGEPQHYAILPVDPARVAPRLLRDELHRRFRVEPVFYRETRDHAGLGTLLHALRAAVKGEGRLPPPENALLADLARADAAGTRWHVPKDFVRETEIHDRLRSLRKRGLVRPVGGGSWQAGTEVEITPLGHYEIDRSVA